MSGSSKAAMLLTTSSWDRKNPYPTKTTPIPARGAAWAERPGGRRLRSKLALLNRAILISITGGMLLRRELTLA
jgi:hypothetical protein